MGDEKDENNSGLRIKEVKAMLRKGDIEFFLNEPVKLVKKGGFVLYGRIRSISEEKGVRSIIIFDAIEEIVQRNGGHGFGY